MSVAGGFLHTFAGNSSQAPARVGTDVAPSAGPGQEFADRLLVYGSDGFTPAELRAMSGALQARPVAVTVGQLFIPSGTGQFALPLATLVVQPDAYADAVGRPAAAVDLAALLTRGVVVSTSAARLLGVHVGAILNPRPGASLVVAAIVPDTMLGGYQAGVARRQAIVEQAGLGDHADYVIVRAIPAQAAEVRRRIASAVPGRALRFVESGARGYFSPSATVLSQSQIQDQFGVLTVRLDDAGLSSDPTWVTANITSRHVALLGHVVCNKKVVAALAAAMTQLQQRGLGHLVETGDFARQGGCWNARTTRGRTALSHHAWGIAVDINVAHNPLGSPPRQDPRLVAVMQAHGFTWGGRWLRPDGAHFEWFGSTPPASGVPRVRPEPATTDQ